MGYRDDVPRGDGMERFSGFHLTQSGYKHCTFGLSGTKGKTQFRIFPEVDMNGVELPFRAGSREFDFTYWMRAEKLVRRFGVNDRFTAFTRVHGKDRNFAGPIERFITSLTRTFKDTPGIVPPEWLKWKDNQGPLAKIEMCGLVQGMLFENAGREYKNPQTGMYKPLHPAILVLPKSAREELERLANTEVPGYTGNPEDYGKRYMCGDFVSCAQGKLVQFTYVPQQGTTMSHYVATVQPKPIPVPLTMVKQEWVAWDKILKFLTMEEQMALLVQYWPAEALDFVFGHSDLADMLPATVRGRWDQRNKPVSYPQATPPQQPTYQQPVYQAPAAAAPAVPLVPPGYVAMTAHTTGHVPGVMAPPPAGAEAPMEYDVESPDIGIEGVDSGVSNGAPFDGGHPVAGAPQVSNMDPTGADQRALDARARLLEAQRAVEAARAAKA